MADATPTYSTLIQCLYDQQRPVVPHYPAYSVFRAIDSRDVTQKPVPLPRVHDFAVIWDSDHDSRVILVIEEMLMAGLLPGVQFIGERKAILTIILAAKTFFEIDVQAFKTKVEGLTKAAQDFWPVELGMFDHTPDSLRSAHQCKFMGITRLNEPNEHAYLLSIDGMWNLGTKAWQGIDTPAKPRAPGQFFSDPDRYIVKPNPAAGLEPVFAPPMSPGVPPSWPPSPMPPFVHPTAARAP